MRIVIHSNGPMVPSGYGQQTRLLLPVLRALGHEPAVSAFYGLSGSRIDFEGTPVYPAGAIDFGLDVLEGHAERHHADLVLTLCDFWRLEPIAQQLRAMPRTLAAWLPVDCAPLGKMDRRALAVSGARPVAMSRFGLEQLAEAGWPDALYVPHAVDTRIFAPDPELRAQRPDGMDGFIVGICAANNDTLRKAWPEQLRAVRMLMEKHSDVILMVHSVANNPRGLDLAQLAQDMGVGPVFFSDPYAQLTGLMDSAVMARWFNSLDVLLACSYGEGFGIPIIEAQACGTPVIVTDASSMGELVEDGWLVAGMPFWNPVHRSYWSRPDVTSMFEALCEAYEASDSVKTARREHVREFALQYDTAAVAQRCWGPALKRLEAGT